MDVKRSIEDLERIISDLIEENKRVPIIVEGDKDVEALRRLGVSGTIIIVNRGVNLTVFSDNIARKYREVIILTDWDRKGGFLCHTIKRNLEGRVSCNTYFREFFAKNSVVRTIEGLPSWIKTVKEKNNVL
jgi:5S rRNA maturation endonuclease (ribonuclease M5)